MNSGASVKLRQATPADQALGQPGELSLVHREEMAREVKAERDLFLELAHRVPHFVSSSSAHGGRIFMMVMVRLAAA